MDLVDGADQFARLRVCQAAGDLVQQQQRGLSGQRPGQLQPLALQQRQRARGHVGASEQACPCEHLGAVGTGVKAFVAAERGAHQQVLEHRHPAKRLRDLVSAAYAAAASLLRRAPCDVVTVKDDPARIRAQVPADQVERAALAGAIGADDSQRLTFCKLEAQVPRHRDGAEALVEVLHAEDRHDQPVSVRFTGTAPAWRAGPARTWRCRC